MKSSPGESSWIDDLDVRIIREFYDLEEEGETTTWRIASKLFKRDFTDPRSPTRLSICRRINKKIKRRIEKMRDYGLFVFTKNSKKNVYHLIEDKVFFSRHKFPNGFRKCVGIHVYDNWQIFEL